MFYLILDFETTGFSSDAIPQNYPVQFACQLVTPSGNIIEEYQTFIKGAIQLSEWSKKNCPHITIEKCNSEGITMEQLLSKLVNIVGDYNCTLVAHNIEYDWDKVMIPQIYKQNLHTSIEFTHLKKHDRLCTMLHDKNKYWNRNLNKWCGPKLENMANKYNIDFDTNQAHDAMYDVDITRQCLAKLLKEPKNQAKQTYR